MPTLNHFHYIGVDIAKAKFDVHQAGEEPMLCYQNEASDIKRFISQCKRTSGAMVVCEATGIYHNKLISACQQAGVASAVVNPRQIRAYAKALGHLEKTDRIDASVITQFAHAKALKPMAMSDKWQQDLAAYQTRLKQLVMMIAKEKNHRESTLDPLLLDDIEANIKHLDDRSKRISSGMLELIRQDESLSELYDLYRSFKGIGERTALLLIAGLPELGKLNQREIAKLVGVAPLACDSGLYQGQRKIYGGRQVIRNGLYMAAVSAIRCNPKIKAYYDALVARGKPKKAAMVASMRKMLCILSSMVKNNTKFIAE